MAIHELQHVPISVAIPTYCRLRSLATALDAIFECRPAPSEVLVHVDFGDNETGPWLRETYPRVLVTESLEPLGPGGGRNRLIAKASNEIVASFDDDSYPLHKDYFAKVMTWFSRCPEAAIVGSTIVHRGEELPGSFDATAYLSAGFVGCGVVYRRSCFLQTGGYVPLRTAYNMEEVDLALRTINLGYAVILVSDLIVFHDTDRLHHASPEVTAYSLANIVLLGFLRYPIVYWPLALAQLARRAWWCLSHERRHGVARGITMIPSHLWRYRRYRATVNSCAIRQFLQLRKRTEPLNLDTAE